MVNLHKYILNYFGDFNTLAAFNNWLRGNKVMFSHYINSSIQISRGNLNRIK